MKTILVTGAKGFIGKNLVIRLKLLEEIKVFEDDIENTTEQLKDIIKDADFIFHLAGINRPTDISQFKTGNLDFTTTLIELVKESRRKIPIVVSSSIQAERNNPYGISKKEAENYLLEYKKQGNEVFIYRLPNVFGKWCKPNYNSVVATFCYNLARNIEITVSNRDNELEFVYIDDVIEEFISILQSGKENTIDYYEIQINYKTTLGELEDKLRIISKNRETLKVPSFSDDFTRKLYATYLSYLPTDNFAYDLKTLSDERGHLFELIKSNEFGQIFISTTKPGITRGNHYHHTKFEKFCVIKGEAEISFRHIITNENVLYKVSGEKPQIVDIPTGYTHNIKNTGQIDLITLFWADEVFNPDKMDTYFEQI